MRITPDTKARHAIDKVAKAQRARHLQRLRDREDREAFTTLDEDNTP